MSQLVVIKNQTGSLKGLNGAYGRVYKYENGFAYVQVNPIAQTTGTNKFRLSGSGYRVIANGKQVISPCIELAAWAHLNPSEKLSKIVSAIKPVRDQLHSDFEGMILSESGIDFLDGFVERTQYYMTQYNHYGSKAIFEELRYHTFKKIGGKTFKVNNNYTSSMTRLMEMMFLETLGFFEKRRAGMSRSEVA